MRVSGILRRDDFSDKIYKTFGGRTDVYFLDEQDGNSWYCIFERCDVPEQKEIITIEGQETELCQIEKGDKIEWETVIVIKEYSGGI